MEYSNKSTGKNWLYFFISLVIMIGFLIFMPEWFWVVLPFVLTYLVAAFDAI